MLVYLVFAAVGLGTWTLGQEARQLALWSVLLVGTLLVGAPRTVRLGLSLSELGRGIVFGLVIGLPMALLFPDVLTTTARRFYGAAGPESLLLRLVLVAPVVEGVYFRGFLQPAVGLGLAAVLYGLAGIILYLPVAATFPAVLATIVAVMAVFGLIYGVVALNYSVVASVACQAAAALALWIVPLVVKPM